MRALVFVAQAQLPESWRMFSRRGSTDDSFPEPKQWNGDDERSGLSASAGKGLAYRCADCAWTGRGGPSALDHHREDHHGIELVSLPGRTVNFSCCETSDGRRVDAEGCRRCSAAIGEDCAPWCDEL